ncbi:hypothetical protein KAI87_02805 [Myxococcota bacterium]|nr:hypothetical protein [Myxococcota bacterium]
MAGIKIDTIQNPEHKAIAGEVDELYGNGDGTLDVGEEQSLFKDVTGTDPKTLPTTPPVQSTSDSYSADRVSGDRPGTRTGGRGDTSLPAPGTRPSATGGSSTGLDVSNLSIQDPALRELVERSADSNGILTAKSDAKLYKYLTTVSQNSWSFDHFSSWSASSSADGRGGASTDPVTTPGAGQQGDRVTIGSAPTTTTGTTTPAPGSTDTTTDGSAPSDLSADSKKAYQMLADSGLLTADELAALADELRVADNNAAIQAASGDPSTSDIGNYYADALRDAGIDLSAHPELADMINDPGAAMASYRDSQRAAGVGGVSAISVPASRAFGGATEVLGKVVKVLGDGAKTVGDDLAAGATIGQAATAGVRTASTQATTTAATQAMTRSAVFSSVMTNAPRAVKGAMIVGPIITAGFSAYENWEAKKLGTRTDAEAKKDFVADVGVSVVSSAVGAGAGVIAAAATGALIGSSVPVVGTIVGFAVGAAVGYFTDKTLRDGVNSVFGW